MKWVSLVSDIMISLVSVSLLYVEITEIKVLEDAPLKFNFLSLSRFLFGESHFS